MVERNKCLCRIIIVKCATVCWTFPDGHLSKTSGIYYIPHPSIISNIVSVEQFVKHTQYVKEYKHFCAVIILVSYTVTFEK